MIKVDFHILKQSEEDSYVYLGRLAEKIIQLQHQLFVYARDAEHASHIDDRLWTFRATSFLPHEILDPCKTQLAPLLISHKAVPATRDVLINLSPTLPDFFSTFTRIIELIYNDGIAQTQGRQKYRQYQTLGCQLQHFEIP